MAVGGHGYDHESGPLSYYSDLPSLGRSSNGTIAKLAAQVGHYTFFCYVLFTSSSGLCPLRQCPIGNS